MGRALIWDATVPLTFHPRRLLLLPQQNRQQTGNVLNNVKDLPERLEF